MERLRGRLGRLGDVVWCQIRAQLSAGTLNNRRERVLMLDDYIQMGSYLSE